MAFSTLFPLTAMWINASIDLITYEEQNLQASG